jgi:hypothetical protein
VIGRRQLITTVFSAPVLIAADENPFCPFMTSAKLDRRTNRDTVRSLFGAWFARDKARFRSHFASAEPEYPEAFEERTKMFDEPDVFGDSMFANEYSRPTIADSRSFGNCELVTVFEKYDYPMRCDGRWVPTAYLFNASFRNPDQPNGSKVWSLELVTSQILDVVSG